MSRPSWVGFWCWSVLAGNAEGLSFRRRQPRVRFRVAGVSLPFVTSGRAMGLLNAGSSGTGVFVGRRRLHGSYTTASTAAALWFQPVFPETAAQSRQVASKKPTALLVGAAGSLERVDQLAVL